MADAYVARAGAVRACGQISAMADRPQPRASRCSIRTARSSGSSSPRWRAIRGLAVVVDHRQRCQRHREGRYRDQSVPVHAAVARSAWHASARREPQVSTVPGRQLCRRRSSSCAAYRRLLPLRRQGARSARGRAAARRRAEPSPNSSSCSSGGSACRSPSRSMYAVIALIAAALGGLDRPAFRQLSCHADPPADRRRAISSPPAIFLCNCRSAAPKAISPISARPSTR